MKILIEESVLRQALGALETEANIYIDNDPEDGPPESMAEAITNLRAAIEAAEKVDPVAWVRRHPDGALTAEFLEHAVIEPVRKKSGAWVPLYTHPAPAVPELGADKTGEV